MRNAPGLVPGVVDGIEDGDGALEVGLAGGGQFDLAGTPREEADLEFALQLPNLLREWRLCDVQALGCAAEVQFLRDGSKVSQVTQFHH